MKVFLSPRDLEEVVREELGSLCLEQHGRLLLAEDRAVSHFAQNTWFDVQEAKIASIGEAARLLREIQRNWWLHSVAKHRRAKLIADKLPPLRPKRLDFPAPLPKLAMGAWTLLDESRLLYSAQTASLFPDGELEFNENKSDPPSRAYLKLWEAFTLEQRWPHPGERVLDLGSSPGGWTWVLDQLGCRVISVDKAPLSTQTAFSPRVEYVNESAFALEPKQTGSVDWLFSDVICYPERLLELVTKWQGFARNFVCTIKFQGPTNFPVIEKFLAVPGSRVRHLYNNKHELTWLKLDIQ